MNNQPVIVYVEDDAHSILVMKMIIEKVMRLNTLTVFQSSDRFMERLLLLNIIPNLFLLDIQMKPYNGFELLHILRAAPQFHTSKIVALTASVMNEEVEKLKQSGFDGAIAKPLDVTVFPTLLKRLMQGESVWYIS